MFGYGVQGCGVIYGKVASFWLLFSWLMLFPEPGASVRTERQPTDAEILAAFPHGAVEIAPNAGVDAVLAHHRSGHPHPHELLHLAEHHDKKSECGSDSVGATHARCLRHHHPARNKVATTPESLARHSPAFPPEPAPEISYDDAPAPAEPTRQNRSGFLQPKAPTRVGHQESGFAPSLLASNNESSHAGVHHGTGSWSHLHSEIHHDQNSLTQSNEHSAQSATEHSQVAHHADSSATEVASASEAQQPVREEQQHEPVAATDKIESSNSVHPQAWTATIQSHDADVVAPVIPDESKSITGAASATSADTLLTASNNDHELVQSEEINSHERLPSENIISEGHGSTGVSGHTHSQSDESTPLISGRDTLALVSANEHHQASATKPLVEATSAPIAEQELVTAALDEPSLVVEESEVMSTPTNMRTAFFAAPLLSASWREQQSTAEALPGDDAPLAYALVSGSQGYVLDRLTDGADYVIQLQGAGSGSLQQLTLSGTLGDSELALQEVEVGNSGWQCQHDASAFVCDTANVEDGEQPLTLHVSAPATMGHHTLQLTVTTTTDTSQESREHTRTLAFGQASDTLQQQLVQAEESGATAFNLPEGIYVGTLYNRPAYPLTLIGNTRNELWLQGDTGTDPLLSADSLEQVRLYGAGTIAVSSAIRHSELHLLQGAATLFVPVVTASKLYLEGTGFAALAGDSDLRLENNLLVAEAAAARLTAPSALFATPAGHKPYRQLLGNTLVNITYLAEDAALADWQVANNLLLSEVARDSFTLLGGDLQGVSISHNLLPTACQWLEGENIYSDTPGVEAATGYTPTSDSPVLDAGDVGMTGELSDLYGNSRLVGAGVDIGAVERQ